MKSQHLSMPLKINMVEVTVEYEFWPGVGFRRTGMGAGDCDPPEPPEVSIDRVLTEDGYDVWPYIAGSQHDEIIEACIEYGESGRLAA